jgi:hypothetical protein
LLIFQVRRIYERLPANTESSQNSTWPLIVVQYSYVRDSASTFWLLSEKRRCSDVDLDFYFSSQVFDASYAVSMLHALLLQPANFQERVVIGK